MSSSIFRVFGILILSLLVFTVINKLFSKTHPAMETSLAFLNAIKQHDLAALERTIDPKLVTINKVGSSPTGVTFKGGNVYNGAFSKRPPSQWTYIKLERLAVDTLTPPLIDDISGIASIKLNTGAMITLHKIDGTWRVYYMPPSE